jgi:UDP-N-acetylglucosamine--N-acetylmuramyl-(pentapeptide) pyrophosphoryl-undecaprenol N-acetylglucosamine transferase
LRAASKRGIPVIIQEQNSYAGVTNKLLAKKAKKICVAYDEMEKFFPAEKIILTGNPIRKELISKLNPSKEAFQYFGIPENKKIILVLGGSLGARTINNGILSSVDAFEQSGYHLLWQTGKIYYLGIIEELGKKKFDNITITEFIDRMDYAYSIADVIISRAGAGTISELCMVGKPVILIPSPNVAEDHQTKNALALVSKEAALMITDQEVPGKILPGVIDLMKDDALKSKLTNNIKKLGIADSSERIAKIIIDCLKEGDLINNKI